MKDFRKINRGNRNRLRSRAVRCLFLIFSSSIAFTGIKKRPNNGRIPNLRALVARQPYSGQAGEYRSVHIENKKICRGCLRGGHTG